MTRSVRPDDRLRSDQPQGTVCTPIVAECAQSTRSVIIRATVELESVIDSDEFASDDGLVVGGDDTHFRGDHGHTAFACGHRHINGIEGFCGVAKTWLATFRGMSKATFYLHWQECECRFNHRHQNLDDILLKLIRDHPRCRHDP